MGSGELRSGESWGQKSWSKGCWSGVEEVQVGLGELGSEKMELGSQGFKSGVGVEAVRVGVGRSLGREVRLGSGRSEGLECGVEFGKLGLGGQEGLGGLGLEKLGSGVLGSGGTWGRKSRDQGG